jgi:glycosyltransferase involved in cell wall biosynthesis
VEVNRRRLEHAAAPEVAVVLITYNHESFIVQSIESVLHQDYAGTIHLVVSDDCSTDATQDAISRSLAGAPRNVRPHPVMRAENVGGFRNLSDTWNLAVDTGSRYIALLEGDDYWVDPEKLSRQVGYLEAHPSATISFGRANELIVPEHGAPWFEEGVLPPSPRPTFNELLGGNFIATCTVLYRSGVLPRFPAWFAECAFRDWPLHLVHACAGEMHYLDRVIGVHRQHSSSRWWNPTTSQRDRVIASEHVQRVAIAHLGTRDNFRRHEVAARRHLWWGPASRNRRERWAHLLAAAALDPRLVLRRLRRARRRASSSGAGAGR